jgi:hypothetical protein
MPYSKDWQKMSAIKPKGYLCYRATKPLQINGRMDDPEWERADWSDLFEDIEGDAKPAPTFGTRFKMLWDNTYLYIGAKLEEPHVWGKITQKNSVIFHDNDFEVFIDPDSDNHNYYEFEVNALNTIWELTLDKPYKDGGRANTPHNLAGLISKVYVDGTLNDPTDIDRFWSVEIAFPWQALAEFTGALPCPPQNGNQWRFNFSRVQWQHQIVNGVYQKIPQTPEHNWVWSPQGIIDMHRPERWGYVQFSTATPHTATFHPDPTEDVRDLLMLIYHNQKGFFDQNQYWAASFGELGLGELAHHPLKPILSATLHGFVAKVRLANGRQLLVNDTSQIWTE